MELQVKQLPLRLFYKVVLAVVVILRIHLLVTVDLLLQLEVVTEYFNQYLTVYPPHKHRILFHQLQLLEPLKQVLEVVVAVHQTLEIQSLIVVLMVVMASL